MKRITRNALTLTLVLVAIGSCRTVTGPNMACYETRPDTVAVIEATGQHVIVHRWHRLETPECEGEPLPVAEVSRGTAY